MSNNKDVKKIETSKLKDVSGGYLYNDENNACGCVPNIKPWQVINDGNGLIEGRYEINEEAIEAAVEKKQSRKEINITEIFELREYRG